MIRDLLHVTTCHFTLPDVSVPILQIQNTVAGIDRKVHEGKNHSLLLEKAAAAIKSELLSKASLNDVHACVRRKHYDEAVTTLGSAIDEKAASESLHHCESRVGVRGHRMHRHFSQQTHLCLCNFAALTKYISILFVCLDHHDRY